MMSNRSIVQKEDPVLREIAEPVTSELFGSKELQEILGDMKRLSEAEDDAVAIAAPQIGVSLRIFLLTERVRDILKSPDLPLIYLNPIIIKTSRDKKLMDGEGCLSVRWLYGNVRRASRVTVEAYDEKGQKFTRGASGLLSQIFQHETDHLNGVLFTDKAKDIRDLPPTKKND